MAPTEDLDRLFEGRKPAVSSDCARLARAHTLELFRVPDLEVEARPTDACVLELQHVSMLDGPGAGVTVEIEVGVAMVRVRRGVDHATQELVLDALEARENRARTLS